MKILKINITNSVNDSENISYHLVANDEEAQLKIDEKRKEVKDWNSLGPESGHMSRRYLDSECTDLEYCTLSDLLYLPLLEVVKILDELKTIAL